MQYIFLISSLSQSFLHFFARSVKGINPLNNPLYRYTARDPHLRYTSARRLRTLGSMFRYGAFWSASSYSSAVNLLQTKPEKGKRVKKLIIMTSQGGSPRRCSGPTGRGRCDSPIGRAGRYGTSYHHGGPGTSPSKVPEDQLMNRLDNPHTNPDTIHRHCHAYHINPKHSLVFVLLDASVCRNYHYTSLLDQDLNHCHQG